MGSKHGPARLAGWCACAVLVATPTAALSTPAAPPGKLVGTWTRTLTPAAARAGGGADIPGRWSIKIARDGTVAIYRPGGDFDTSGTITVQGSRFTLSVPSVCAVVLGRYHWTASSSHLVIRRLADPCQRRQLFAGRWLRKR